MTINAKIMVWIRGVFSCCNPSMAHKLLAVCLFLTLCAMFAPPANALMEIWDHQPYKHDRFYSGTSPEKAFIGEGYDWSGVGISWNNRWATMISDQYFLTAKHAFPSGTVTFYEENICDIPAQRHTYAIDSMVAYFGDLAIGRLTTPIDPADNITFYPLFEFDNENDYIGLTFYVYGQIHRVGRNQIDGLTTSSMTYNFEGPPDGLGDDECLLIAGDSGGPSFVSCNGELCLIGTHWYNILEIDPQISGDNFIPRHIHEIMDIVDVTTVTPIDGDVNMDGIVDEIDITIMATNHGRLTGATWTMGDMDHDDDVDDNDAALIASNWLKRADSLATATAAIDVENMPEPSIALLLISGLAILFFRNCFRSWWPIV